MLTRANTLELVWSTGLLVAGVDRRDRSRSASRSPGSSPAPTCPGRRLWAVGGGAAARDPELRRRLLPARRVRAARAAAADSSGSSGSRRSTATGARSRALTLSTYPYVLLLVSRRAARARPVARGGRPRARPDAARGLPAGDAARAAAVDRRRRAARRALRALRLRRRLADAVRRRSPAPSTSQYRVALRPDARRGARARARRADRARPAARGPLAAPRRRGAGPERRGSRVAHQLGRWRWPALAYCAAVVGAFLAVPAAVLVYWLARGIDRAELPWHETVNSMSASALAAVVAVVAALPVALLATATRRAGRGCSSGCRSPATRCPGS